MKKGILRGHREISSMNGWENVPIFRKIPSKGMNVENILNLYSLAKFYKTFVGIKRC
jgi:hypothetical protein